jgi:hypothetical protein
MPSEVEVNRFVCQLCMEVIRDGDRVMRCLEGTIQDGLDANELHVETVLWFHLECFYAWADIKKEAE